MMTKAEEQKLLNKIKTLLEGADPDGYIAIAFRGCVEVAQTNIDNDWGCSLADRAESAEAKVEALELAGKQLQEKNRELQKQLEEQLAKQFSKSELSDLYNIISTERQTYYAQSKEMAKIIVERADNTESKEFKRAVENHRIAKRLMARADGLLEKLNTRW